MKKNAIIFLKAAFLLLGVFSACPTRGADEISWQTNVVQAMQLAQQQNKPILLHFSADFCGPCRVMEKEVFPKPEIVRNINENFIPVKIDTQKDQATTNKYGVTGIPADIFVTPDGDVLHKRVGGVNAQQYSNEIQKASDIYRSQAVAGAPLISPAPASPPMQQPNMVPALQTAAASPSYASQNSNSGGAWSSTPSGRPPSVSNEPAPNGPNGSMLELGIGTPLGTALVASSPVNQPINQPVHPPINSPANYSVAPEPHKQPQASVSSQFFPSQMEAMTQVAQVSAMPPIDNPLLFDGFCPVMLSEQTRWVRGNSQFSVEYDGGIYYCASQDALQRFLQSPQTYASVAAGTDIVALTLQKRKVTGSRRFGAWYNGQIYLFVDKANFEQFQTNPAYFAAQIPLLGQLSQQNMR